ncbi:hypothetical protein Tco_0060840 [Tanacetum coccineum]
MGLLTPSDIQHSAATQIWGCYRLGADEEISDGGSPRVIVYGYDGLSTQLVSPPSPDYIPDPKDPQTPFVPQDEDELEEQPLPLVDSPTAGSPGYITESDPEEDPGEYEDGETEDGLIDYHMDGGDDGDDDDGDSSGDDTDEEDEDDEDEEDEITVRPQASISLSPEAEVKRLLAMTTPSPSPPISLSPPSAGECLARITSTQALIDAVTAALPSHPLPLLPPSLYIPLPIDHRDDVPESELPPRKRFCLSTLCSRYEIGESSTTRPTRGRGVDYGFVSTVDAEARRQGTSEVGYSIKDTWVDPAEAIPEDAQDGRTRISQRVAMDSQRVDLLMGDRMNLQETVWIVEEEAYTSREAWAHSIRLSISGTATAAEYSHSDTAPETLRVMRDMRQEMSDMQAEQIMAPTTRQGQITPTSNTNPNNMTPKSVQAMIDQAVLRNSTNGDGSHSSHEDNQRNVQTARLCFYADFIKCQPLNFKGTLKAWSV